MKHLTISLVSLFYVKVAIAGSFVDSLAKEYGKENGCYSISLEEKNVKNNYSKQYSKENSQKLEKNR